jgi:glc operon protein GlcG
MEKSVVVAVADPHGELIAFARMDGAPISSIRIAANKAWTAARERKPTQEIGEKVRHPENEHDIAPSDELAPTPKKSWKWGKHSSLRRC